MHRADDPHPTDEKADAEQAPNAGTTAEQMNHARSLVEVGADEVFIDPGRPPRQVLGLASVFIEGVRGASSAARCCRWLLRTGSV